MRGDMSVAELGIVVPTDDIKSATDELGNLRNEADQAERTTDRMSKGMDRHFAKLRLAALAAGTAGVAAFRQQANRADDLAKTAQRIGIAVDELSRLQYMADLSGVSMGGLQSAVQRMSRAMVDAEDKFAEVGIAVRDADGNMRGARDVMTDLADVLASMPDGAQKTALAMELMGRGGTELIPMLNGGAEALRSMAAEADSLGLVITPEMAKNAEAFNDNITRLQRNITGLTTSVTTALLPSVVSFSDSVVLGAQRLREGDWEGVFQGWANAAGRASASISADWERTKDDAARVVRNITDGLASIVQDGVSTVSQLAASLAAGMGSIATQAIDWAAAVVRSIIDGLAGLYQAGIEAIRELARGMRESVTGLIDDAASWGRDIAAGLAGGVTRGADRVRGAVTGLAGNVRDWFTDEVEIQSPSRVFFRFGEFISEGLANGITAGEGQAKQAMQSMADGIAGVLSNAIISGGSIGKGLRGLALNMLGNASSGMIRSGLSGLMGMIPGFENGGTIARGGLARMNERGLGELVALPSGSTVIPHDLSKAAMQGQSAQNVHVTVSVDDNGNLQAFVDRRAQAHAGAAVRSYDQGLPQRVQAAMKHRRG